MPTLTWSAVNGATQYKPADSYRSSICYLILTQNGISYTGYTVFDLSNNMTYYWRVAATNGTITSSYSSAWSFNTGLVAPSVPVLFLLQITQQVFLLLHCCHGMLLLMLNHIT